MSQLPALFDDERVSPISPQHPSHHHTPSPPTTARQHYHRLSSPVHVTSSFLSLALSHCHCRSALSPWCCHSKSSTPPPPPPPPLTTAARLSSASRLTPSLYQPSTTPTPTTATATLPTVTSTARPPSTTNPTAMTAHKNCRQRRRRTMRRVSTVVDALR